MCFRALVIPLTQKFSGGLMKITIVFRNSFNLEKNACAKYETLLQSMKHEEYLSGQHFGYIFELNWQLIQA
jgi:hypothetical protein